MTDETKYTPGPWSLDEVRTTSGRAFRIGAGEMLEAGKGCCIIYDDYPGNPENERSANARLISAAPDLLQMLKVAQLWLDIDGRYDMQGINAAIAKAEGK